MPVTLPSTKVAVPFRYDRKEKETDATKYREGGVPQCGGSLERNKG